MWSRSIIIPRLQCIHSRSFHVGAVQFGKRNRNPYNILKQKTGKDLALQHFDGFYSGVFGDKWASMRLGLLSEPKYCAVINFFVEHDEVEKIMIEDLRAVNLRTYYERHHKYWNRFQTRMKMLAEKKARKIAKIAEEQGIDPSEIDPKTVEVSDISDSELKQHGYSTVNTSDIASDFPEMLSEKEMVDDLNPGQQGFFNQASIDLDLNDYVPVSDFKSQEDIVTEEPYFKFYEIDTEVPVKIEVQKKLEIPETLKIYMLKRGRLEEFPNPGKHSTMGLFTHYVMDGASCLPVLAMDLQPQDEVADFCAAPGGKALLSLMTLRPAYLLCNERSPGRYDRMKNVFRTYVPELDCLKGVINLRNGDALELRARDRFDKILVDTPCTNDRHSLHENDNNYFDSKRLTERTELPIKQLDLLLTALMSVRPNGTVVYSTCTLSPIQNDGVVHMALKRIWEDSNMEFSVVNMKESLRPLRGLFKFWPTKYGNLVRPFLPNNFGPMYFCKLVRTK